MLNNILAKIQSNLAGCDDALMLDDNGFVAETNATNVFIVKDRTVLTPTGDACLPGITRKLVIEICEANDIVCVERNLSLVEFHTADECFTTGTMGELSPVTEIDGRIIGDGTVGSITRKLQQFYAVKTAQEGEPLPF